MVVSDLIVTIKHDCMRQWEALGLGACRMCFLACVLMASSFPAGENAVLALFLGGFAGAAVLVFMVRAVKVVGRFINAVLFVSFAVLLAGTCFILLLKGNLALSGFVLCGIGGSICWIVWLAKMSQLAENHMLVLSLCGLLLGFCLGLCLIAVHVPLPVLVLGFGAASVALCVRFQPSAKMCDSTKLRDGRMGFHQATFSFKVVASIMTLLFTLTAIYSLSSVSILFSRGIPVVHVADYIAATALLALIFLLSSRVGVITVCRIAIPVIAFAFLLYGFLPSSLIPMCFSLLETSLVFAQLFLFLMLARIVHDAADHAVFVMSLSVLVMSVARLLSFGVSLTSASAVLSGESEVLRLSLLVILLVVVLFVLPSGWKHVEQDRMVSTETQSFDVLCAQYAKQYGLTPRETDVLQLAARGYSQSVMAEKLFITEGTVHVHLSHIYQKMGVSGKQELIALFAQS